MAGKFLDHDGLSYFWSKLKAILQDLQGRTYIVEEGGTGTQDNWHYRKWSDGTLECWIRKQYTGVAITSTAGQLKYASLTGVANYPVTFYYYPVLTITGMVTNGNGWVTGNNANYSTTNPGGLIAYSYASQSSTGVTVNIYAIGRWKA